MNITKNFTFEELTKTQTGLKNVPGTEEIINLTLLAVFVLQPLRDAYGKPIIVSSGFRSKLVNERVGGVASSQHLKGQAADIRTVSDKPEDNRKLFELIQQLGLPYDQLIDEQGYNWIHVSYSSRHRRQVLHLK